MSEPTPPEALEITAQLLLSLSSGGDPATWPETLPLTAQVAMDWQNLGPMSTFSELHGRAARLPPGRLSEIIGRVAAAGEQLGLAWTYEQDMLRWNDAAVRNREARGLAARSLAEIVGYYAISAGHGLINVTLRTLLIHDGAAAVINGKYKRAEGFEPYADTREVWRPLNEPGAELLQKAAGVTAQPSTIRLADLLADLTRDPRWAAVSGQRDIDFHRWRPQSVTGGVATTNPWEPTAGGAHQLRAYVTSQHQPPDTNLLMQEASAGLTALAETMRDWLAAWPTALRSLGVPVFKQDQL